MITVEVFKRYVEKNNWF